MMLNNYNRMLPIYKPGTSLVTLVADGHLHSLEAEQIQEEAQRQGYHIARADLDKCLKYLDQELAIDRAS